MINKKIKYKASVSFQFHYTYYVKNMRCFNLITVIKMENLVSKDT